MWKTLGPWKWIGIAFILFDLLYENFEPYIKSKYGRTGATISAVVLLYLRIRDRQEAREIKARVAALEEGRAWNGDTKTSYGMVRRNCRKLFSLLQPAVDRVKRRRREKMKQQVIDKVWLIGLIGLIGSIVGRMFDISLPVGYEELIYDAGVAVFTLITAFKNMMKPKPAQHPFEGVTERVNQEYFGDHGPAI